jgi:transcriptional regulator with XRE-family HTH domain
MIGLSVADRRRVFRGDRLLAMRNKRGYSQADLAQIADLGPNQVYRYEANTAEPTPEVLVKLASALEVTTDYLLGLVDSPRDHLEEQGLTPAERRVLAAYRHGDFREMMKAALEDNQQSPAT